MAIVGVDRERALWGVGRFGRYLLSSLPSGLGQGWGQKRSIRGRGTSILHKVQRIVEAREIPGRLESRFGRKKREVQRALPASERSRGTRQLGAIAVGRFPVG